MDGLQQIAALGIDGCLLSWVDYLGGIQQWNAEIMPLLEQAGLRRPLRR